MKIVFDAKRLFHNNTGLGNYSRTLVNDLLDFYPQYDITLIGTNTTRSRYFDSFNERTSIVDPTPKMKSYWRSFSIYKDISLINPSIYHGLSNEIPFTSSSIKASKILSIHDLFYEKFPQDFSFLDRKIYKKKAKLSCEKADHIIAISHSTKQDIINILGVKPEKISVIYQSCNRVFQEKQSGFFSSNSSLFQNLPSDFALFVGTLNKRKNIIGLIKALSIIPKTERIPLVVVGSGSKLFTKELQLLIKSEKLEKEVFLVGNIPNDKLKALYKKARFTCLLSFYEGFGIPVIESLFCNTPVIVGANSSLIEAAGNCGIKCDPKNIFEISQAIKDFTNDSSLLYDYQLNIPDHIEKFTSESTSKQLHNLYSLYKF